MRDNIDDLCERYLAPRERQSLRNAKERRDYFRNEAKSYAVMVKTLKNRARKRAETEQR